MDLKEAELISHYHSRIVGGPFTEKDVLALLILLRSHAPRRSAVREFGDFVAHRERDRGVFAEFLRTQASHPAVEVKSPPDEVLAGIMQATPVFSDEDIFRSVNAVLAQLGFQSLPSDRRGPFVVCLMSLLQRAQLQTSDGSVAGEFILAFNSEKVVLFAKLRRPNGTEELLVVLSTPSKYVRFVQMDPQHIMSVPNELVTTVNVSGEIRLLSL